MKVLKGFFLTLCIFLSFTACSYEPATYYAKRELNKDVFVALDLSLTEPRNSVLIKDAITKILIQRLGSKLVDSQEESDIIMNLKIKSVDFTTLQYDKDGYNKLYKAKVSIGVRYLDKSTQKAKDFSVLGETNFAVDIGSSINDTHKYNAIREASNDAMTEILSRIAISSFE